VGVCDVGRTIVGSAETMVTVEGARINVHNWTGMRVPLLPRHSLRKPGHEPFRSDRPFKPLAQGERRGPSQFLSRRCRVYEE